jgi:hypothetical protein
VLSETTLAGALGRSYLGAPKKALGILAEDYCLAVPGDTTARSFLVEWLSPPAVRFGDGQTWCLPEHYRRELVPDGQSPEERALTQARQRACTDAVDVQRRWNVFLSAQRGY